MRRWRAGLIAVRRQVVLGGAVVLLMAGCSREQVAGAKMELEPKGAASSSSASHNGTRLEPGFPSPGKAAVQEVTTAGGLKVSLAGGARAKVVPERAGTLPSKSLTLRAMHPEKVLQSFPIPVSTTK